MYVYLGLGTNQGERVAHLRAALAAIIRDGIMLEAGIVCSPVYESAPMYVIDQPRFLNMAIAGAVPDGITPAELLRRLKAIEAQLGRDLGANALRYGPRPLDIDIEFVTKGELARGPRDHLIIAAPDLTIPHPRLAERAFVLYPLRDLAPDLMHPLLGLSIADLASVITGQDLKRLGTLEELAQRDAE